MRARQRNTPTPEALSRLDAERDRYGITLATVAAEASKTAKRGTVSVPTVSRVLHAHTKSANVVATVRRLIAEAKAAREVAA